MAEQSKEDPVITQIAITAVRFLTPVLLSVLAFIALQANHTLENVVLEMQKMQITLATEGAEKGEMKRILIDHETRLRLLETRK